MLVEDVFNGESQTEFNFYENRGSIGSIGSNNNGSGKMHLANGAVRGLNWQWIVQKDNASMTTTSKKVISSYLKFTWEHSSRILGFTGTITFIIKKGNGVSKKNVDVLLEYSGQWVGERCLVEAEDNDVIGHQQNFQQRRNTLEMNFSLVPVYEDVDTVIAMANFKQSDRTDAILEVEGQHLHVNKSFLSFHSDFFNKLFNSEFKEKTMPVIPIKSVTLDDFVNFLSLIYPKSQPPTVEKVSKYLEMADMFIMPMANEKCETFLLQHEQIKPIQKIMLADRHNLRRVLRETLGSVGTEEELKAFTRLGEFNGLSDATKAAILHRFMHFFK